MLSKEILKKIREIEITTSQKVAETFAGRYQSVFKGRGMEFSEVREYQPGDDIRSIDWNVTARTGNPHIKKFIEERELSVILMLDASLSCQFGTKQKLKSELAAEVSSVLAFSAIRNSDKIGLIIFTDIIEKFLHPQKGSDHVLRIIRESLCFKAKQKRTDISVPLRFLDKITTGKAVCFIISDFFSPDYAKALTIANKRHDIIAVRIIDPAEQKLTNTGIIQFQDAENNQQFVVDTTNKAGLLKYQLYSQKIQKAQEKMFSYANIDSINLYTDKPYINPLIEFFDKRRLRLAGE